MTPTPEQPAPSPSDDELPLGAIIVARHGERIDYILRDAGSNWIPTSSRPWDPPLTANGFQQGQRLGGRIPQLLKHHNLPPVTAVYSSPLIRCCQTASAVIVGLNGEEEGTSAIFEEGEANGSSDACGGLRIRVEQGLVESLNEKWYRSWCLPGSDSTWNYPGHDYQDVASYHPGEKFAQGKTTKGEVSSKESTSIWAVDEETLHPMAKVPVQELLGEVSDVVQNLESCSLGEAQPTAISKPLYGGDVTARLIDTNYTTSCHSITPHYQWNTFESRRIQMDRAESTVKQLARRHPGETILLFSHGGPVTYLYERLTGFGWEKHGVSKYTSVSVYTHVEGERWSDVVVNDTSHLEG